MTQRPSHVIRSSELRAQRGKTRVSGRGETDDLKARLVKTETQAFRNLRGDAAALKLIAETGLTTGTWTPTVALATPGTSSIAYDYQNGDYFRIGPMVTVQARVGFTPTIGTGSGNLRFGGLPFDASSILGGGTVFFIDALSFIWPAGSTTLMIGANLATDYLTLYGMGSGLSLPTAFDEANITNAAFHDIFYQATYKTSD